jgi:hypothetical protein
MKLKLCYIIFLLGAVACGSMDATYKDIIEGGEIKYVGKPLEVRAVAGSKRITLGWKPPVDPSCTGFKVLWNSRTDSMLFPLPASTALDSGFMYVDIAPLETGLYLFHVHATDNQGNQSVRVPIQMATLPDD